MAAVRLSFTRTTWDVDSLESAAKSSIRDRWGLQSEMVTDCWIKPAATAITTSLTMTLVQGAKTLVKSRCHRLLHTQSAMRSHIDPLFCYTSGRWLWNEQLEARYRYFDISGLQQAACQAVGANKCVSLEKIGEGNYNKVYRLGMDDGQKAIARIPHPNAGPRSLTTASEVATMEFARTVLHIPVPRVLAWSNNEQNSVKAEYIIMEEAQGSQLHEIWESLSLRDKCQLICEFVDIEKRLLSVSFEKIGSLYFKNSNIPGCQPAAVQSGPQDVLDHIESTYCIGPITRREFWQKQRGTMQYHGPWASATEYLQSVACREIEWINTHAKLQEPNATPWQYTSPQQQSPEAHTALLHKFLAAVPHITPREGELASPRLWHPDFHAGNMYVDNGHISCIIDWQGAWTAPVFIGANPPLLLDYSIDMLMELPLNLRDLDKDTQARLRHQVSQSILIATYERRTARTNPLMEKAMRYRHGQTLKQLEAFVGATWDNCLFPFEECLMRVQREWDHVCADGTWPCPFGFSAEETRRHGDEAESFNKSQAFWKALQGVLTDEGYTTHERFGTAVAVLKELREGGLGGLAGEERCWFDGETRWVAALDT